MLMTTRLRRQLFESNGAEVCDVEWDDSKVGGRDYN
jgi:hypothetical protein